MVLVRSMNLEHLFDNTLPQFRPHRHRPSMAMVPVTTRDSWCGLSERLGAREGKRRISGHPGLLKTRLGPSNKASVNFREKGYHVISFFDVPRPASALPWPPCGAHPPARDSMLSKLRPALGQRGGVFERSTSGAGYPRIA